MVHSEGCCASGRNKDEGSQQRKIAEKGCQRRNASFASNVAAAAAAAAAADAAAGTTAAAATAAATAAMAIVASARRFCAHPSGPYHPARQRVRSRVLELHRRMRSLAHANAVSLICWHALSHRVESPTEGRGRCSRLGQCRQRLARPSAARAPPPAPVQPLPPRPAARGSPPSHTAPAGSAARQCPRPPPPPGPPPAAPGTAPPPRRPPQSHPQAALAGPGAALPPPMHRSTCRQDRLHRKPQRENPARKLHPEGRLAAQADQPVCSLQRARGRRRAGPPLRTPRPPAAGPWPPSRRHTANHWAARRAAVIPGDSGILWRSPVSVATVTLPRTSSQLASPAAALPGVSRSGRPPGRRRSNSTRCWSDFSSRGAGPTYVPIPRPGTSTLVSAGGGSRGTAMPSARRCIAACWAAAAVLAAAAAFLHVGSEAGSSPWASIAAAIRASKRARRPDCWLPTWPAAVTGHGAGRRAVQ